MSINALSSIPQNAVITTGNGQIYLTWDQVVGATGYTVQRSTTGLVGSFTTIAGAIAINNYLDTGVATGTAYWYQIASNNPSGTSSFQTLGTNGQVLSAVPCLPGQINLGFLRYMSKLKADKLNSQFLTTDEWNFNIQQSTFRLYDLLVTKFGDSYFLAPPLQFNTNGTANYPLPDGLLYNGAPALYKLAGVDVGINATNNEWFTLPRFNFIDRNRYSTLQLAGTVQSIYGLAYDVMGNTLMFIPLPTNAQTIQLWYVPVLQQMVLDTDMMPFSISGWSELVIVDAAIKALIKEESYEQATVLIQERAGLIERIEETAANRDVGQPNTISNTRARAGDQNFGSFGGFGSSGFGNGFGWGG
jgi:cytochrome c-type biogenesis protein CcmH/NrfF